MVNRNSIINYINDYLGSALIKDASQNGLQVEGTENIRKIVFGVSANLEFFKKAAAAKADMVITHHGLLWSQNPAVTGIFKKRIEFLIEHDINLASWHLPLDMHAVLGNNAQIAKKLGVKNIKSFGVYHGVKIGFMGLLPKEMALKEVENKLAVKSNLVLNFGKSKSKTVAIISGGGYDMFEQAVDAGADLFITGSSEEFVQEIAREGKINYMALGHYNSEVYGVKALMGLVGKKFKVSTEFIDVANPI